MKRGEIPIFFGISSPSPSGEGVGGGMKGCEMGFENEIYWAERAAEASGKVFRLVHQERLATLGLSAALRETRRMARTRHRVERAVPSLAG